jgi:hypothetical protein
MQVEHVFDPMKLNKKTKIPLLMLGFTLSWHGLFYLQFYKELVLYTNPLLLIENVF